MANFAILELTDGTTTIDLLGTPAGFYIAEWEPQTAYYKSDGVWQDSPIANGRQLAAGYWANVVETIELKARTASADIMAQYVQDLRRLLLKAESYWKSQWQTEPVWLVARARQETNTRYALLYAGRLVTDDNYYGQPFLQPRCRAVMDDLTLVLERGHWTENAPGTGTCVAANAQQSTAYPYHLEFDGDTSVVLVSDDAAIQDLHDAAFTVDGWARADSRGEINVGRIIGKEKWHFGFNDSLFAYIECAVGPGQSDIDTGYDGQWHHFAMTWDDATYNYPRIWIDGAQAAYDGTANRIGAVVSDVGDDLRLGNRADGAAGWDGALGWWRVSNVVRWTTTFTPPAQCVFPAVDANTVALWIREGTGTAIDNAEGTAALDGTATNTTWATVCDTDFGRTATCSEGEVFIANKHNLAQLTHIFIDDAGVYGPNLLGETLPYDLLPAVPFAGDSVYFGIDSAALNSGPFASLVFDLSAVIFDITLEWRYWNGAAWVALTVQDNTNADGAATGEPLDTLGVRSVHWEQPADWATTAVNGVTGYWVRLFLTGSNVAPEPATQQNRHPYTIIWPYVDVAADQVPGDITALGRALVRNQSDNFPGGGIPNELYANRLFMGTRAISRGADFSAFLNASDVQNPSFITTSVGGVGVFASSVRSPTGRIARYTNVAADWTNSFTWLLDSTGAAQYVGTYRAFIRGHLTSGEISDLQLRLRTLIAPITWTSSIDSYTDPVQFLTTEDWSIIDCGAIRLPPTQQIVGTELSYINITLQAYGDGSVDFDLYDLILIPVDEWAGDFYDPDMGVQTSIGGRATSLDHYLDVDSITIPKLAIRSILFITATDLAHTAYVPIVPGEMQIGANSDSRIWFVMITSSESQAYFEIANTAQTYRQARYLTMRGAR